MFIAKLSIDFNLRRASVPCFEPTHLFHARTRQFACNRSAARCGRGCSRDGSFNLATVVWENEKDKKLVLPIPSGCATEEARDEAEKAIRDLAVEMGSISVKSAQGQALRAKKQNLPLRNTIRCMTD